jgi:hypothetical protein
VPNELCVCSNGKQQTRKAQDIMYYEICTNKPSFGNSILYDVPINCLLLHGILFCMALHCVVVKESVLDGVLSNLAREKEKGRIEWFRSLTAAPVLPGTASLTLV